MDTERRPTADVTGDVTGDLSGPARVTVVVVTRNRRRRLLESLPHHFAGVDRGIRAGPAVIVVDDHSDDGTAEAVRSFGTQTRLDDSGVAVLSTQRNVGVAGRNLGVALASTRYVAFSDDDSWWEPGSLDAAADLLDERPDVGLVVGSVLVGAGRTPDPINSALADANDVLGFLACAAVMRRDLFLALGGFPTRFGVGSEETLLAVDLAVHGKTVLFHPPLRVVHEPGDGPEREDRIVRSAGNAILIALARRRASGIVPAGWRILRDADRRHWTAVTRRVAGGLRWVLVNRRAVPRQIELSLAALDQPGPGRAPNR